MASLHGNGRGSHPAAENQARLVFWEVTKGCNLRCVHCRATATELSSPTDLTTRAALDVLMASDGIDMLLERAIAAATRRSRELAG